MRKYNIPFKDVKEVKQEIVECSSGGGGIIEYLYIKTPTLAPNTNFSFYITYGILCSVKGVNKLINRVMETSPIGPYFSSIEVIAIKVVKGIILQNGVEYDLTTGSKFIQNNGLNDSEWIEITEEEYENLTIL